MLSKRLNDIIFIAIIVLVLIGIVIARFMVLSTMDGRIEEIEAENRQLENEIAADISLVEEYRYENIPTASELARFIPSHYSRNTLMYFVFAQLELAGIRDESGRELRVEIQEDISYPSESRFNELSNRFSANRIEIRFNTSEPIDEIDNVIEQLYGVDQVFLLQNVRYEASESEQVAPRVVINFVTFYNLD